MQRNHTCKGGSASLRRLACLTLLALVIVGLGACTDADLDGLGGATIESMTITPDTISTSDTGMTDEFFTVSLIVSGFSDPIDVEATEVFIQATGEDIAAFPESVEMVGDEIVLDNIAKTWVGGLEPGIYEVGARVQTVPPEGSTRPSETVTERNLATITITDGG